MTGSVGTAGADLNLSSLVFVAGASFGLTAFTWSQPQNSGPVGNSWEQPVMAFSANSTSATAVRSPSRPGLMSAI